jgi:Mrp family chromosome partitioning ATPase
MLHRLACLLVSFLAVSCDPEGAPVVDEGKAGTRSDAPGRDKPAEREAAPEVSIGTAPAPVVAEVPAGRSGFVDCLLRCDGAKMSHAEKATCRYNCEGVAPGAPVVAGNPGASDTAFLFFTGKGGVGKTSLSTATALTLADAGRSACCW